MDSLLRRPLQESNLLSSGGKNNTGAAAGVKPVWPHTVSLSLYDTKGESKMEICSPLLTNTNKKRFYIYIYII